MRLKPLTQFLYGDDRPKQFCPIFGETTLLAQSRQRAARLVPESNTSFVVTRAHEAFYSIELDDVEPHRLIVQPQNRGTAPALLYSLLRIYYKDADATVTILPSDHYYSDEHGFTETLDLAFDMVQRQPEKVVLLGAVPTHPETEYGWIEPGTSLEDSDETIYEVRGFWEKPSRDMSQQLMNNGCLWNTFVMVGCVETLLQMIADAEPGLFNAFRSINVAHIGETRVLESLYNQIPAIDFSKRILAAATDKLSVLRLDRSEWSDLGDPGRVVATLIENGSRPAWLSEWRKVSSYTPAVAAVCA